MPVRPQLTERCDDALVFAARLHAGDIRKGNRDPVPRPLGTASIALEQACIRARRLARYSIDATEQRRNPMNARERRWQPGTS
jgi:hypothetical protein